MTSRDRVLRTLNHQPVDWAPRDLWPTPALERVRGDELAAMLHRFPLDLERPDYKYPRGSRAVGKPSEVGQHTDSWGCAWRVAEAGNAGVPQEPPLADKAEIARYKPPQELLDPGRKEKVDRFCDRTSRFVLAWSEVRPLDRLKLLRGDVTVPDLAHGTREIRGLLQTLHEFFCRDLELWAATEIDGVVIHDAWGTANGLAANPKIFRELFKPLYRQYCQILRARDKFVFFRTAGNACAIIGDLVEIGVDAVHLPLTQVDLDKLAAAYRGRIAFWGAIDEQRTLPMGNLNEVRAEVQHIRRAFDFGRGGLIAQCRWDVHTPYHNVAALFDEWTRAMPVRSA